MAELTKEYLDQRLESTVRAILEVVDRRFDAVEGEIAELKQSLASLASSVDRFVKMHSDLQQEVIVLRKQLKDMEVRVARLEQTHSA